MGREVRIGTAGWTIPAAVRERFPAEGSGLERYAQRFSCVEINSTFYRPHRASTYARWAASVPDGFRFSLKLPKEITHVRRFVDALGAVEGFLSESEPLGEKRAVLLIQLPPSFAYDAGSSDAFFRGFRARYGGALACEPRHPTWFGKEAEGALRAFEIARVAADPARVPDAALPGGWDGFAYYRLHGSPQMYASAYTRDALVALAGELRARPAPAWCVFDNTSRGAAAGDALGLAELLRE